MYSKVLIVGTSPYDKQGPARAFESYFKNWEKENLMQIFSSPKEPSAGHCSQLYQITDQQMLKRWFSSKVKTGKLYKFEQLIKNKKIEKKNKKKQSKIINKLYMIGSKKFPLNYLLRGILWKKKFWCTTELIELVDNFKPECIFLAFSDDYFIPKIALYFAKRYDIPIVSCIGDDYYFNEKFSLSPFYWLYRITYKKLIRQIFSHGGSAAYIGDKIKNKYNKEFCLNGETVYLTSEIEPHKFRPINSKCPKITYCGNIRLGRNHSLNAIGKALGKLNSNYKLDVYSNEKDKKFFDELLKNPNIDFHGSIPYSKVMEVMENSDILVVVEGFLKKDIRVTRYSLSTKVADSLSTGGAVLAYGSIECGAIEYLKEIKCASVCTDESKLEETITNIINNIEEQKKNYEIALKTISLHHNLDKSTSVFENIVMDTIQTYKNK